MQKVYTLKQIIFSLRQEYLEIEKQLMELKSYIEIEGLQDCYFNVACSPCKMFLYLTKKKNLLDKIMIRLGTYVYGKDIHDVTFNLEERYFAGRNKKCTILEQEILRKEIDKIMQSEFVQNISANDFVYIPSIESDKNSLKIDASSIQLLTSSASEYPWFDYFPLKDEIRANFIINGNRELVTAKDILKVLNLNFDSKYLNEYHLKFLEKYEEKDIEVEGNFLAKSVNFEIIEQPKKIILKPKYNMKK